MRLHHQFRTVLMEPSAAVTIMHFNEIHRPVMFRRPVGVIDFAHGGIQKHDAPWTQQRHHAPVAGPNISVQVMAVAVR
jgi:hypothetical protein